VSEERFEAYLEDIAAEARRARRLYDLLVIPGAEITQNHLRSRKNAHIVGLNISAGHRAPISLENGFRF